LVGADSHFQEKRKATAFSLKLACESKLVLDQMAAPARQVMGGSLKPRTYISYKEKVSCDRSILSLIRGHGTLFSNRYDILEQENVKF
jgi:hypothetical protein